MRRASSWLVLVFGAWSSACTVAEQFSCEADDQCKSNGIAGRCEAGGVCSFPDEGCPSGQRYGEHSGALAGECVDLDTGTSPASDGGTTASPTPETEGVDGSGTSTSTSTTTTGPSSSSTVDPSSTSTTSSDSGSSTTGPEPDPYGPCQDGGGCLAADSMCLPAPDGTSVCVPSCDNGPCPEPPPPATAVCSPISAKFEGCVLLCSKLLDCPMGMDCLLFAAEGICVWP
ncbi:hypothetical protein [Paraliomyxa miuraensis]|uniref:hypothetical protein n=1 Tax=Paraliomyxa miuraensis TaxID=376150 RepID=UPI00224FB71A|nr:hypothetical protein [Paraliomyxa miuraensis]MCX4239886.1 hypothetical protein [Paraliomyxa miuraensis]